MTTDTPCQGSRERCLGRIINPIGHLGSGKHIAEVRLMTGHEHMLTRRDDGRNHQVGIALPSVMPPLGAFHHGRTGGVTHHDWEWGEHLLRVQQPSVCQGCLSWRSFRGNVAPPTEHFGDDHRWEGHLGPRHTLEMPALGAHGLAQRRGGYSHPRDTCALFHIPYGLAVLFEVIEEGIPRGVGLGLPKPFPRPYEGGLCCNAPPTRAAGGAER